MSNQITREDVPNFMEIVLVRLIREMRRYLSTRLKDSLFITFTTANEYYDEERGQFLCDPPIPRKSKNAVTPTIAMSNMTWTRNNTLYKNDFSYTPTRVRNESGELVDAVVKSNPIDILQVSLETRLFEIKPQDLTKLQYWIFTYFNENPYLFIPEDGDLEREYTDCELATLKKEWFSCVDQLSIPGFFVKQNLPVSGVIFNTNLRSSKGNLVVSSTNIILEDLPVPDSMVLGTFNLFKSGCIELFGVSGNTPLEIEQAEFSDEFVLEDTE